jgi:hypothetical protein
MKTSKLLLASLLAASALAGTAGAAPSEIYVLGAPAFRQIGTTATVNALKAASGSGATLTEAWTGGGSLTSANSVNIYGGSVNGTSVIVHITYSGSTGAVQSLAAGTTGTSGTTVFPGLFLPDTATGASNPDPTVSTNPASDFVSAFANFGLTDTFQTTTPFHGTNKLTGTAITYGTLQEFNGSNPPNAIIAYKFLGPVGTPSGLNLSYSQAQDLFTSGVQPLAIITGNAADENTLVYAVGRDPASGSRYVFLAESGIGSANDAELVQNFVTTSGSTITGYTASPATTINHISYPSGNGGYPSFSKVLTGLEATANASTGYFITYVGAPDAVTAQAAGAVEVSWNGNVLGTTLEGASNTAPANLAEGRYTFWSYIHVPYPTGLSTSNPAAYNLAKDVYNDLGTDATTGAILVSDTQITRASDGAPVTETYF